MSASQKEPNLPPIKICHHCFYVMPSARRVCHLCGYEFYPSRAKGGVK
jgi:hypothetical protein